MGSVSRWAPGVVLAGFMAACGAVPASAQPVAIEDAWPVTHTVTQGAPNVLLILLDDVGFGAASTFGGPVATPTFEALASEGLRYNRFHTTSVCSPTRAALLTGRNQHRSNFGTASGVEQPQAGYSGIWPRSTASVAQVLRSNGYSTGAFGKWHNTPNWESSPVGPFDRWPTGLGFEYFYGFMAGEADQWDPILYRNTSSAKAPSASGYHFTTDMTDDAIGWLHTHQSLVPDKPYFMYFAPGATHAPHQVPKEWIDKYRGHFDQGWDRIREETLARQERLGVVPRNTQLTARPQELPAWSSLSSDAKELMARQMEVYAGFLSYTDHEIGRLIDAARNGPGGDNLLILYIMGDNGSSAEGGMHGSDHNLTDIFYGMGADDIPTQLARAGQLGSDKLDNHFAIPWAWALNAPFQWTKQTASHLGGTRNPMVVSWPGHITDRGGVRQQWTHVIDVVPTLYDLIGIEPPANVDGVKQLSIDGISFSYTLAGNKPEPPHRTQYFEMFGNRALYQDGWMASARHSLPWEMIGREASFANDKWELYNLETDFSQSIDLAAKFPAKLAKMKLAFDIEARRNGVYPMIAEIGNNTPKPSLQAGRSIFTFHRDGAPIPSLTGAPMLLGPHRLMADIVVPAFRPAGTIVSSGAREGGFALFVDGEGHLIYVNNYGGKHRDLIRSANPLKPGRARIEVGVGRSGSGFHAQLKVDGAVVADGAIPRLGPPSYLGAFCVGRSCGSPVGTGYAGSFTFPGEIGSVQIVR